MTTSTRKAILGYLMAVFVVGVAIGVTTGYAVARKAPARLPSEQEAEGQWLAKYRAELALTEEQVRAIQPLLPKAVDQLGAIWFRAILTMGAVQESVDRKVEPLLDERQRRILVEYIRENREERLRIASAKLDAESRKGNNIWFAAAVGDTEAIRRHLQAGVDVNKPELGFGLPPLSVSAIHGRSASIDLLLHEGADVNARHPDGGTALHAAAFFGRVDVVQQLVKSGADLGARNEEGQTALESMEADWETIEFIGAILQVELDKEEVLAGRETVAELLREDLRNR